MKLSDYFKIVKPQYVYLRITPNNSIRNYNSEKIAKAIHSMFKTLNRRIRKQEKQFFYESPSKVSYYIYIEKNRIEFYFIIPELYLSLFKEKITNTWNSITITRVDKIPLFSNNPIKYQLTYSKEDALSLAVDKRSNILLSSLLNVIEVLEEDDRVGIFYNFIPTSQITFKNDYKRTMDKLDKNQPVDRQKMNAKYVGKMCIILLLELTNMLSEVMADLFGNTKVEKTEQSMLEIALFKLGKKGLSDETNSKKDRIILDTQILVLGESKDNFRKKNNVVSVCESFKSITGDNELIYKPYKNKENVNFTDFKITRLDTIKISTDESQNFLQLPGREILEQYKAIERIETQETEVPDELQQGTMCIGVNIFRGLKKRAYLSSDKDLKNLTLTIIGPTRAGKTNLIANLSKNALDNNECAVLFDFCGNNELSNEVSSVMDKNKVLNIDCSDSSKLQGLGYNEITPKDNTVFEVYRCAKAKTSQLMTLINSINPDDGELKARMERYLEAAAVTVFISEGPIKDVFQVLQDHNMRQRYISMIPSNQNENLEEYILALQELDDWSRGTKDNPPEIIGTKISFAQGILNRVNKLKSNTYMELMLKKDCSNNINLVEEMQKSQLICIRMPETMFSTETEKDIYCTYWLTKIWGALQKRKWDIQEADKRTKVNIVFDELYQVPSCQEFLRSKLSQIAKFTCKPIISCHYLGQIGIIRDELKAANSSYMLISGCDKDNYKELKDELYPYIVEDLLNLERFSSLNLIKYEKGYAKFITKLPTDIIIKS